ncbi:MAG: hypothetical protein OER77_09080 [Myxococcales bacterium]|nr:hypothetical protein [Myxococcales bacterium]
MTGIIKGDLLAGLVINIGGAVQNELVMKDQWDAALQSLDRPPISGASALWLILMGFAMGIALVWIYAAVSPRFTESRKAAVAAGLITWLLVYVLAFGWSAAMDVYSTKLYLSTVGWTLFETLAASFAGAWLYERA